MTGLQKQIYSYVLEKEAVPADSVAQALNLEEDIASENLDCLYRGKYIKVRKIIRVGKARVLIYMSPLAEQLDRIENV